MTYLMWMCRVMFQTYTPIYRLTERKKRFHVQNCPCGTIRANIGNGLGLLVHGKVVVELTIDFFPQMNVFKWCLLQNGHLFSWKISLK